ncbi:MAG: hypothetical protein ABIS69_01820 [Sediminibacterium sp.]
MATKIKQPIWLSKEKATHRLTALEVDVLQHSTVDHLRPDSASDIGGSNGLINS